MREESLSEESGDPRQLAAGSNFGEIPAEKTARAKRKKYKAFAFKDNRAFCKYICPITVFLKPMSYFSLFRIKCDREKCVNCGKCRRVCPMDVDVTDNSRRRKNGTECILCMECVKNCPKDAL